jgi:hypothetical protein
MAISQFRDIVFSVLGDGVSTVFSVDLSSAPVSLLPDTNGGTVGITQPGFNFRVSPATAIVSVGINDPVNPGSTATAILAKAILTVTLSAAPDNALNPARVVVRLSF